MKVAQITTTYSFWNAFRNCRKACEWRYLKQLAPIQREQALFFGTLIHTCLEMWHGGGVVAALVVFVGTMLNRWWEDA